MARSYSSSLRRIPSSSSASHLDTLRSSWAARTLSHAATSSGNVTVTFFMAQISCYTKFVSTDSVRLRG